MTPSATASNTSDKKQEKQFAEFKANVESRGVFLIFERTFIMPGDQIPEQYITLTPHYRLLTRHERRSRPKVVRRQVVL
jgi:hypothetical protein